MSKLSAEQKQKMRALLLEGMSFRQIARLTKTTATTVSAYQKVLQKSNNSEHGMYSREELSELFSYMGPHDDAVTMLADFMVGTKKEAETLIAEFNKSRK